MGILDKIRRTKQPRTPYTRNSYWGMGGAVPPDRNTAGFLKAYGEIGWLHAVVFRIALGCSEVKWTLHDTSNRDKPRQVYEHPVLRLLNLVNPFMTSPEFIALDTIYQELVGECFWILNYNALGEPAEIWIPYPHEMTVVPDKDRYIKGYVYGTGGNAIPFNVDEVIHFKYPSPLNQYRGLGPAQAISVDLDAEMYSGQWNRNFFYNSARPDGVIEFDYNLADEQFSRLKEQWKEKHQGTSKAHQVALLEGGGKYRQIQNTVKDMDFSNLKLRNRDSILGVYGMPISVMGITENVNKANAEAGEYTFARWIVKPRLTWKAAKLQEQLIPKFRKSDRLQICFEEVVPQTAEQKRQDAEAGIKGGYWTVNEARTSTGKDPIPGGDVLLVPLNMIPTPITEIKPPEPEEPTEPEETPEENTEPKGKGMTADQKQAYWERYAQKTEQQEKAFERVFESVFMKQKDIVSAYFKENTQIPKDLNDEETARRFEPIIELSYQDAYEGAFKVLDSYAIDWISARSLFLAKSINDTALVALRAELSIGMALGESIPTLTKRLEGYFTGNVKMRAEMVARSEVIAASNEGALHRYEKEGVEKSEFYPSMGACDDCLAKVGEYPTKQAHGIIPVHPRCRCTWLPVV